ncbi:hypothetical protein [Streptomonospora litoralis]|uniref:Uncharacterized protein n=1 Tax=Streptomonospora litoralis TaxID=2498135 RepID=A0A4P6PX07_9ACTN|nr:hypothetical protein [Streptomonospora litoralis]QBI52776.1 hypothetical protein EKD16_04845 [Streptomonospora litoralis]
MADRPAHRNRSTPTTIADSGGRADLSRLATAVTHYGVRARVVDDTAPYLRVGNPESDYAEEDVYCEPRSHGHDFVASFGVHLGSSDSIEPTARKVAWLVGAADES